MDTQKLLARVCLALTLAAGCAEPVAPYNPDTGLSGSDTGTVVTGDTGTVVTGDGSVVVTDDDQETVALFQGTVYRKQETIPPTSTQGKQA